MNDQQLARHFLATKSASGTTISPVLQEFTPPPSSSPGDAFSQNSGSYKRKSYTVTHTSSSDPMKIKLTSNINAPLQTSVFASKVHSNRREENKTSTVLAQPALTQSPTGEGKLPKIVAEKRTLQTLDKSDSANPNLAKTAEAVKRRKRVLERSDAESSPVKVAKLSTSDFEKRRSHAREKLRVALTNVCKHAKVSVTDGDCGKMAQEMEQEIYSLPNVKCSEKEYQKKYRALAINIKKPDNLDLIRRLMAKQLLPGKFQIALIFFQRSLVSYNV